MTSEPAQTSGSLSRTGIVPDADIRKIFKHMTQGCIYFKILTDGAGKTAGYSVVGYNDSMRRLLGNTTCGGIAKAVKNFVSQVDLLPPLAGAALNGTTRAWEQYLDSRQKWYSLATFSPEKYYAVLQIEDITARKSLEKTLEESRKRYEVLLKQSSDAIAVADDISKTIIEANARLCQITGYTEDELCGMSIYSLLASEKTDIDKCQTELSAQHYLPEATSLVRCKNGTTIEMERVVSLVKYNSHHLQLVTLFEVSEERKLLEVIKEDVVLASQVQQQMLPGEVQNEIIEIKGIYRPLHMVSGDFFDYRLSKDKTALTGFLVDVAGHGLATALQTAAINVLLQEVIIQERMPTKSELHKLNKQMMGYFNEGSFAALLIFHFDFPHNSLICAFCGINQILVSCSLKQGWIKAKGSIIGAFDSSEFDFIKVPIQPGDSFYFLTDGLSENLPEAILDNLGDFPATTEGLAKTANSKRITDDCSAICIKMAESSRGYQYYFFGMDDVVNLQKEIRRKLNSMAGDKALHLEIALNEAINNILMHGSGNGCIKIKSIGKRVILRVKDCKKGFDSRAVLQQFACRTTKEIAETASSMETGRGILIMKLFTDKIYYNRSGSEIILVSKVDKPSS